MSESPRMSKNLDSSEFSELVSDVEDEFVNSDDECKITFGSPQQETGQHERRSNSALEVDEFNRHTLQTETPTVDDEIDIKYEVNDDGHISTPVAEEGLDTGAGLLKINTKPLKLESINSEEKELNGFYSDLFLCEQDCVICQKYIRKLRQHVRVTHAADLHTRDPLHIDPVVTDPSAAIENKREMDEDVERMDCSEECDPNSAIVSGNDSDPEYNASRDLNRKCKTSQKQCKDHKGDKSARKDETKIPNMKKGFKCEECDKSFTRKDSLIAHMMLHTGERPFKCEECGRSFTKHYDLTAHMRIHTGEKPYNCAQCERSFTTKSDLNSHLMNHTGERPFMCKVCRKTFRTSSHLSVHIITHAEEKPFKCEQCDRRFNTKSTLTAHRIFHTGDKPFVCVLCGKSFKIRKYLTMHLRTHTGEKPFKCEQCGKCFRRTGALCAHRKSHNEGRPYKCDMCDKDFKRPDSLYAHKKKYCPKNV